MIAVCTMKLRGSWRKGKIKIREHQVKLVKKRLGKKGKPNWHFRQNVFALYGMPLKHYILTVMAKAKLCETKPWRCHANVLASVYFIVFLM